MMKRRIAFVTRKMIVGGVERSLVSLLNHLDYSAWDVDLYVEEPGGELYGEIPREVSVKTIERVHPSDVLKRPLLVFYKAVTAIVMKLFRISYIRQCCWAAKADVPVEKAYDIAVSYHAPNTLPVFFVIDKMKAGKKVLWLHGDMENNAGHTLLAQKYYAQYDQVFAVSQYVMNSYNKISSSHSSQRRNVFYNYLDTDKILRLSEVGITYRDSFEGTTILTIARLSHQKGIDIAIQACSMIVKKGYNIRWYVCGDGSEKKDLSKLIKEHELTDNFFLLGNILNPYGYLKDCDLYVQTSRYEGFCTTTNEAKVLKKPIITTDVSGASEQIINGVNGWIVAIDPGAVANRVIWCIEHPENVKTAAQNITLQNDVFEKNLSMLVS